MIQAGKPVRDDFLGRVEERSMLAMLLKNNQSVALIAPRRHGKTSLMERVLKDVSGEIPHFQIDIMNVGSKRELAEKIIDGAYSIYGMRGFVASFLRNAGKAVRHTINALAKVGISTAGTDDIQLELTGELLRGTDDDKLLDHALKLPQVIAEKLGKNIIFAVDELGEIKELRDSERILKRMRSIFQKQQNIIFLFAGSQFTVMNNIFKDRGSAFYNFAELLTLRPMTGEEFRPYFRKIYSDAGVVMPDWFPGLIEKSARGIPYYMVKIGNNTLFKTILAGKKEVFRTSVLRSVMDTFEQESGYISRELGKTKGNRYQKPILVAIAKGGDIYETTKALGAEYPNARREVRALIEKGLIRETRGTLDIVDPFIGYFLKKEG